jgi:hypothetical protein
VTSYRPLAGFIATVTLAATSTLALGVAPAQAQEPTKKKTCAQGGPCSIGDKGPGGGTVFYVAKTKQTWGRYLEAAPAKWSGKLNSPQLPWCDVTDTLVPGSTGVGLGDGKANTAAIAAACTSGAASRAAAYRGGKKSDWYLPSKGELNVLYKKRKAVGGFPAWTHWSSSEASQQAAWLQGFAGGVQNETNKSYLGSLRPIRAF